MKLIIHRGAKQIGGSCVELATEHTRLIIDAGLPLDDMFAGLLAHNRGMCRPPSVYGWVTLQLVGIGL